MENEIKKLLGITKKDKAYKHKIINKPQIGHKYISYILPINDKVKGLKKGDTIEFVFSNSKITLYSKIEGVVFFDDYVEIKIKYNNEIANKI